MPPWIKKHSTPELELARTVVNEGSQPLLIVHSLAILQRENDRLMALAIRDCREEERSWAEIADALGVSRQAARRRFMHLNDIQ